LKDKFNFILVVLSMQKSVLKMNICDGEDSDGDDTA